MDAYLRFARIDAGTHALVGAEAVADSILDAQGNEFQTLERTFHRHHIDANRLLGSKPFRPRRIEGQLVDVVFPGVLAIGHAPEHAGGDARVQVDGVAGRPVGYEMDATGNRLEVRDARGGNVFGE